MADVDPPIIPIPQAFRDDPAVFAWAEQLQRHLNQHWERTGAGEDYVEGLQASGATYQALASEIEALGKQQAAIQAQLAQISATSINNELGSIQDQVNNLQSQLAQLFGKVNNNDQDQIRYKNITKIPDAIDAIDGLSPANRRVIEYTGSASATLRALSGADNTIITGTAGSSGKLAEFNGDGDAVEVTQLSGLTAKDSATVDNTYGSEEAGVIQNNRTRIDEIESRLTTKGIL